jgi:hypothetical protein
VLLILVAALLLVVLGFLAAWAWHARELASANPSSQVGAQGFSTPSAGAARQNEGTGAAKP